MYTKMKTLPFPLAMLLGALCLLAVCPVTNGEQAIEASFYGESFVLDPVQDASEDISISLDFQTTRPEGLLLLAAGQLDYILVQLNAGMIETRANLGSGEAVLFSARGVRLNDSRWHRVTVSCMQGVLFLVIDGKSQGQASTPGQFHKLNVDLGVYLGGKGLLNKDFLRGDVTPFRGCLRSAMFNGRDILSNVRALQKTSQVVWQCDDQFTAASDLEISLLHKFSYVAFPYSRIYQESNSVFSCDLKTRSEDAVVLFNSGSGLTSGDFIAVELVSGRPKLSVDRGSGLIHISLETSVNDGKWHTLTVTTSETSAKIQVDFHQNQTTFHLGGQNYLNLGSRLYVGGLDDRARLKATRLGLASLKRPAPMEPSLLGCLRNISMDSVKLGFPQVQASHMLGVSCKWGFPCAQNPCIDTATCKEVDKTEFRCHCNQAVCVKDVFAQRMRNSSSHIGNIFSVKEVVVPKGGSALIGQAVIGVSEHYKYDFRQQNVVFYLKDPPRNGVIMVQGRSRNVNSFTWRDLTSNSVSYVHRRPSSTMDTMTLEVSVALPQSQTRVNHRFDFVLPVRVESRSLKVKTPNRQTFGITLGGKIHITSSVLNIESETDPSLITFTVVFLQKAASHYVLSTDPTRPVTLFTYRNVQQGEVWFQLKGDSVVYTKLNVTDGRSHTEVELLFREQKFELKLKQNTGMTMSYGSRQLITEQNLTAAAGSKFEEVEVRYQVMRPPRYGALQRLMENSQWMDVREFTQKDIDSGVVRYHHIPDSSFASDDSFEFRVTSKDSSLQTQTFRIRFKAVILSVERNEKLVIHESSYNSFTNESLLVMSNNENLDFRDIIFSVMRPPSKGKLYLARRPVAHLYDFDLLPALKTDKTFTQLDVNRGLVYYKYNKPSIGRDSDFTDLQASYFGYTVMVRIIIQYSPGNLGARVVNNRLMGVLEGGMKVITKQALFIETDKYKNFTFSVSEGPSYGSLNLIDPKTQVVLSKGLSSFVTGQLVTGKIAYFHDDSETDKDSFVFKASPNIEGSGEDIPQEIAEFKGTFRITMTMRNDNAPVRISSKVFYVVEGQTKTMSLHDLRFEDPDIDFDDSELHYQRQEIAIGDILDKTTEEKVYNFTQRDLLERRLMFSHKEGSGARARVPILVSDGQFFSNSILEIQASKPFVKVLGSYRLQVESGERVVIETNNIGVESNLDFEPENVWFRLSAAPQYGTLQVNGNTNADFSYSDLLAGRVKYIHAGENVMSDSLRFNILLKSFEKSARLIIDVTSQDTTGPPEIIHNQVFRVKASQIQVISSDFLEATHRGYIPGEIHYIVTELPRHGHLVIAGRPAKAGTAPEFTQEDINKRIVVYASNSLIHLTDKFTFDVGTELESLRDMEFVIETIPERVQVTQTNITVAEGGSLALSTELFTFHTHLSSTSEITFSLDLAPVHGKVTIKGRDSGFFSFQDLSRQRVLYVHDGSESVTDIFTIKATPKHDSHPGEMLTILVTVEPVDDQPPRIVVNSGLDLWSGSLALLTGRQLQAIDPDTGSFDLEYRVTSLPSNGHLAFLNNTFKSVKAFTQLDLDSEQLVFVHRGAEYGQFTVKVTDGKNEGGTAVIQVQARPVSITMTTLAPVYAFPRAVQPITNRSLLGEVSASNFSHPIIYTLVTPRPLKGRLVTLLGRQVVEIKSFTQGEVNQGNVFYQHRAPMMSWQEVDQLTFEVSTTYAQPLTNKVLDIDISFSNINVDNYRDLLNIKPAKLREGEKVTISKDNFDSTDFVRTLQMFKRDVAVHFSFESMANHGWLWFKDEENEIGQEFTQSDLDSRRLVYKHDDSDSLEDKFLFGIRILVPRSHNEPDLSVAGLRFNFSISVEPVNDGMFELLTRHPKISVLQGSEVLLTAANLSTIDTDTGPAGLEYIVETQPVNGMLVLASQPTTRLHRFTQLDIDQLQVIFKHDGSAKASSSLYFKVWDKVFPHTYANLDIIVRPLVITVGSGAYIPIVQGSRTVTLTPEQFQVRTNGDLSRLTYMVRQAPQFGRLTRQAAPVTHFSQQDLEAGRVHYTQDADSTGEDFFVLNMNLSYIAVSRALVTYELVQKPLVRQGPLVAEGGSYVAITRATLDAGQLAQLTDDDPLFTVSNRPRYGRIMKRRRQRREAGEESSFKLVSEFTFEDIIYTRVYYVPNPTGVDEASEDSFEYILSARGVPPAKGKLMIGLEGPAGRDKPTHTGSDVDPDVGRDDTQPPKGTGGESNKDSSASDEVGEEEPEAEEGPNVAQGSSGGDKNRNIIIIVVVLVLCLLIIVLLVAVFVWRRRRASERSGGEIKPVSKPRPLISGPLQLEQPHVLIQPKPDGADFAYGEGNEGLSDSQEMEAIALVPPTTFSGGDNSGGAGKEMLYVNSAHIREQQQQEVASSPDVTLVAARARPESESSVSEGLGERLYTLNSGRGSSASGDLIDWTLMDPDLLQSCNVATPALGNNQYWL